MEDVRDRLRDPAAARDILDLDGLNPRVQDVVLRTPGARELLANLADYATLPAGPRRIAIGCAGGRHRVVDRSAANTLSFECRPHAGLPTERRGQHHHINHSAPPCLNRCRRSGIFV
ncbi:hypothetical protein [Streptomyces longwoodensis]|uniref:RapZ C-terminal domain-containing protein n=1 Tax=Streptomyces longwoodensis TaxID=68231 RepID=UPI00384F5515